MWFYLCVSALLGNLVVSQFLLQRLKSAHRAVWEGLGSPRYGDSNLSSQWLRLIKFVWRLEFLKLRDPALNRLGWTALGGEVIALLAFGGMLVSY